MTELISCQVTDSELSQIDDLIARTGQTRSEWLNGIIKAALSETPTNIRHLTERVTILEQKTDHVTALQRQVEHLAQQVAMYLSEVPISPPSPPGSVPVAAPHVPLDPNHNRPIITSDDDDDEPDEVLYDFLESTQPSPSHSPENIYDAEDEPDEILYDFLDDDAQPF